MWDIAQEEGLRLESLLKYNLLQPNMYPKVGEVLHLQKQASEMPKLFSLRNIFNERPKEDEKVIEKPAPVYNFHTVEPKQTLYAISKKYEVSVEEIMQWNNLDTTNLKTGQQLRINKK